MAGDLHEDDVSETVHETTLTDPSQDPIPASLPKPIDQISRIPTKADRPDDLTLIRSHTSHHDIHGVTQVETNASSYVEINASQYERFTPARKTIITTVLSICGFLAPISSTTILSAIPEVAAEYNTSGSLINLSNALYLLFMGFSPCVWGPISTIYGRRPICIISAILFTIFSIATALAPDLASYFIFRMLTAFQGTAFLIVGSSCLGDIYTPTERATALGWFLSGTLIGPAFGPFIGGIIVTFRTWRDIFWLQSALGGLGIAGVLFFLPETIPVKKITTLSHLPRAQRHRQILAWINPLRVLSLLFSYPNLLFPGLASASLVWNMYSLLTPIRYVLNPRFHLTSPIQSGLFYIAPGCGYLLGTFFGGRYADFIVKRHLRLKGRRVSEDRLRSCVPFIGAIIPGCMLVYGWSVDRAVGGIPLPVLAMFVQGIAQLFCFPSLNTYCLDVMQKQGRGAEVVAGNYMIRYVFAAAGSAVCLPAIESIGVGWFSTVSCGFMVASAAAVWGVTRWGEGWRHKVDERRRARRKAKESKEGDVEKVDGSSGRGLEKKVDGKPTSLALGPTPVTLGSTELPSKEGPTLPAKS